MPHTRKTERKKMLTFTVGDSTSHIRSWIAAKKIHLYATKDQKRKKIASNGLNACDG